MWFFCSLQLNGENGAENFLSLSNQTCVFPLSTLSTLANHTSNIYKAHIDVFSKINAELRWLHRVLLNVDARASVMFL